MGQAGATARAKADSLRYPYTQADIDFMSGMIHHHAQAIVISRWAPSHGAERRGAAPHRAHHQCADRRDRPDADLAQGPQPGSAAVDTLGNVPMAPAQAPTPDDTRGTAGMPMASMSTMPGMLTDAQLKELDAARGTGVRPPVPHLHDPAPPWRRVDGARRCSRAQGAGQDETIFKFAADVEVDQSTEIRRMLSMLLEMAMSAADLSTAAVRSVLPSSAPSITPEASRCRCTVSIRTSALVARRSSHGAAALVGARGLRRRQARRPPQHHRRHRRRPVARTRASASRPASSTPAKATSNLKVVCEGRVAAGLPRHHELRPRLHRQLRHPGQLQRPGDLGHRQPGQAEARRGVRLPRVAERRLGVQEPDVHVGRSEQRPRRLHAGRRAPTR